MFTYVAVPLQAQRLTGSFVVVGLLGLVEVVPLIVFGLWGGALADHLDRRRMVLIGEVGAASCTTVLFINALSSSPRVWVLFLVGGFFAAFDSIQRPSLDALIPQIVPHDQITSAAALLSLRGNATFIFGTALGGFVASYLGVATSYGLDIISYVISFALLVQLTSRGRMSDEQSLPGLSSIGDGVRYAWNRKDLLGTYAIDTTAMIFAFPTAVFPFVAQKYQAPWALGLLFAAPAIGAGVASLTSGWTTRVHRHGRAIFLAAITYGATITLFGISPSLQFALLFLALSGAADMVSVVFRQAIWNMSIPDAIRGRLAGIELMSYAIGPQLGNARVSLGAQWRGLTASIATGGILCAAGVFGLALSLPSLWTYDTRTSPHVSEVRAEREKQQN
jgi:MFS family permease